MTPQTNWMPGIIALAVSLLCGIGYLLLQRSKGSASPAPEPQKDGALDDLDRRAQSLIEQLKELVADKHNHSPEQFEAEKARLEKEAAAALRARDEYLQKRKPGTAGAPGTADTTAPAPGQAAPAPTGFAARNPQLVGALWGAGVVLFFGTIGYLLVSEQRTRDEGMEATGRLPPGQSGMGQQQQQMPPQEDAQFAEAMERLRANPSDLEAAGFVGHEMIRNRQLDDAEKITKKALAIDPFHIESRVHLGVLHAIRGDTSGAEKELVELADTYPGAQEALLFLGFINLQSGNRPQALQYFERFTVEVPRDQQPPGLDSAIAQLRQEVGQAP